LTLRHAGDEALRFEIPNGPLPACVVGPRVFPHVELEEVDAIDAKILEALLRVFLDVVRWEDVLEFRPARRRPVVILGG
jgi:hypothetical protein